MSCRTGLIDKKVSREEFNKAIKIFPELIFYLNENRIHLVWNKNIYSIIEEQIEHMSKFEHLVNPIIEALSRNMALLQYKTDQQIDVGNSFMTDTFDLLTKIAVNTNKDFIERNGKAFILTKASES